jgi:hypothetical protein
MSELAKKLYYRKGGSTVAIKRYSDVAEMSGKPYLCTKSMKAVAKAIINMLEYQDPNKGSQNYWVGSMPYTVEAGDNQLYIQGSGFGIDANFATITVYKNGTVLCALTNTDGVDNTPEAAYYSISEGDNISFDYSFIGGQINAYVLLKLLVSGSELETGYSPLAATSNKSTDLRVRKNGTVYRVDSDRFGGDTEIVIAEGSNSSTYTVASYTSIPPGYTRLHIEWDLSNVVFIFVILNSGMVANQFTAGNQYGLDYGTIDYDFNIVEDTVTCNWIEGGTGTGQGDIYAYIE